MIRQLRSETVKLLSVPLFWAVGAATLAISLAATGMITSAALAARNGGIDLADPASVRNLYTICSLVVNVTALIFGCLFVTAEFEHKTITQTLTATPSWTKVFLGKFLVVGVFQAVLGAAAIASSGMVVWAVLASSGRSAFLAESMPWMAASVLSAVVWAGIGVALGFATHNGVVGVMAAILITNFIEPTVRIAMSGTASARLAELLPGAASDAVVGGTIFSNATGAPLASPIFGVTVLTSWLLAASAVAYALSTKREVK